MKTIFAFAFLISTGAFAQSIVLEDAMDIFSNVTTKYAYSEGTGAAAIEATYSQNSEEGMTENYNFTIKGLSFNKQTEEVTFDNGINEYVCARIEHKRFVFRYKVLVETGNCKIVNQVYSRTVTTSDGLNTTSQKRAYRKITFVVENSDQVTNTNWNVQKWPVNN